MHVPDKVAINWWRLGDATVSVQENPSYNPEAHTKHLSPSLI